MMTSHKTLPKILRLRKFAIPANREVLINLQCECREEVDNPESPKPWLQAAVPMIKQKT